MSLSVVTAIFQVDLG